MKSIEQRPVTVKMLIRGKGYTIEEVARAMNITSRSLSNKMMGSTEFKGSELVSLSTILGVSIEAIMEAVENAKEE